MCGIAGLVRHNARADLKITVREMLTRLTHRGPDGEGVWSDGSAFLGHRRLAIIDLQTGDQPMAGDSGVVGVLNGEIYNYLELRRELEDRGACFRTTSDTEVLIKAYEAYGESCLERFIGMYAFAIWDPLPRRLFLARDRLGKKPLFIHHSDGLFAFASEIKALLAVPEIAAGATPDPLAISDFLSLGYALEPKTIFRNIRRVPAGHIAVYRMSEDALATRSYWSLEEHFHAPRIANDSAAHTRFTELLRDAVRLRLRSDVPLGIYLSGGVDSSAVAATAKELTTRPPSAFCVGFGEASFDESPHARAVARHCGIDLKVIENAPWTPSSISQLIWHIDEPFADTSIMPTYLLNRAARGHLTVALSGDGCDELLAGYLTYTANRLFSYYRRVPASIRAAAAALGRSFLRPSYRKVSWDYMARQFLAAPPDDRERAHYWWRVIFADAEKDRIMGPELREACRGYDPFDTFHALFGKVARAGFLAQCQYVDIKTWLEGDILVKADRMSMANGVEVRSPFLDHRLVEFCATLADDGKISGLRQKTILKDTMAGHLPPRTLRRFKRGFNAPVGAHGALSIVDASRSGLFNSNFRLDPASEDVTYKSFGFSTLNAWLGLYAGLRRSGNWNWEPT